MMVFNAEWQPPQVSEGMVEYLEYIYFYMIHFIYEQCQKKMGHMMERKQTGSIFDVHFFFSNHNHQQTW